MIISPSIDQEFRRKYPYLELLNKIVREIIFKYCSTNGYAFTDRIKAIDSLSEKIETGRFLKLSDIDDFYALSIIIPNLNKETEVLNFLK